MRVVGDDGGVRRRLVGVDGNLELALSLVVGVGAGFELHYALSLTDSAIRHLRRFLSPAI